MKKKIEIILLILLLGFSLSTGAQDLPPTDDPPIDNDLPPTDDPPIDDDLPPTDDPPIDAAPINDGILYLFIAGFLFAGKVAYDKNKNCF